MQHFFIVNIGYILFWLLLFVLFYIQLKGIVPKHIMIIHGQYKILC